MTVQQQQSRELKRLTSSVAQPGLHGLAIGVVDAKLRARHCYDSADDGSSDGEPNSDVVIGWVRVDHADGIGRHERPALHDGPLRKTPVFALAVPQKKKTHCLRAKVNTFSWRCATQPEKSALPIEQSTPGFANSRVRALPHVHPRGLGSRPSF